MKLLIDNLDYYHPNIRRESRLQYRRLVDYLGLQDDNIGVSVEERDPTVLDISSHCNSQSTNSAWLGLKVLFLPQDLGRPQRQGGRLVEVLQTCPG